MSCTFDIVVNGCFVEIIEQPSTDLKFQLNAATLTYTEVNAGVVAIKDGDGNRFSARIDAINGYATIPLLFAFLDVTRDACAPATSGGGGITPTTSIGTYTRITATGAGNTTASILGLVVTNIGGSNGTFAGATLAAGQTEVISKIFNEATGDVNLIPAIAYDATGTTFTISEFV